MKLFIDTGNLKEIEELVPLGIVDGITTNPSLLAKEAADPRALLKKICEVVQGPVSAEVVATDAEGMIAGGAGTGGHRPAHRRSRCRSARRACGRAARWRPRGTASTSRWCSRPLRRCWRRRSARPTSARSSAGSTTSRPRGCGSSRRSSRSSTTTSTAPRCSSPASAIPCTSSRPARMGADVCTCPAAVHRVDVQAPAHRPRPPALPQGLGEGARRT